MCAFLLVACSKSSPTLTTPTPTPTTGAGGSTLKTNTPTPQSPVNNQQPSTLPVVLTAANASPSFASAVALQYRFEIYDASGAPVHSALVPAGAGTTSYSLPIDLEGEKPYAWAVRTEYQGAIGAWSPRAAFIAPTSTGYVRGTELYDPLNNGKTIGNIGGPVTFLPGVGVRLESQGSFIAYQLGGTLEAGEISLLITNTPANTEGNKTKVFAMASGYSDLTTNPFRMTVEKRGDPQGSIAWRFISSNGSPQVVDTVGAERRGIGMVGSQTYLFRATWGGQFFRVTVNEGGANGREIYNFGKPYEGFYEPSPHVIYIGSPPNRSGIDNQSIQFMVARQLWVSGRPRPSFANK
jgi:hypothetical protein